MVRPRRNSPTLLPPPTHDPSLSPIENSLSLTPLPSLGPGIFSNTHPLYVPPGARGIFGGAVIAQSLLAAQFTVPAGFHPHSIHCYFVLAGAPSKPVIYHVETIRSGRSFHTRSVQAKQDGACVFQCTVSFTIPPRTGADGEKLPTVEHSTSFPADVPSPDKCESTADAVARLLRDGRIDEEHASRIRDSFNRNPFEWRRIPSQTPVDANPASLATLNWVRSKVPLNQPEIYAAAGLAYLSDGESLTTVCRVNPTARPENIGMMVSLDHTIHFHGRQDVDGWMLMRSECPWSGDERALVRQQIFSADGKGLMATCEQEGVVRLRDGRDGVGGDVAVEAAGDAKKEKEKEVEVLVMKGGVREAQKGGIKAKL